MVSIRAQQENDESVCIITDESHSVPEVAQNKPGKPSLPADEAERVRAAIVALLDTPEFGGNKTKLGKALGLSQPGVTALVQGGNKASVKTAHAVAELLKISEWELRAGIRKIPIDTLVAKGVEFVRAVNALRALWPDDKAAELAIDRLSAWPADPNIGRERWEEDLKAERRKVIRERDSAEAEARMLPDTIERAPTNRSRRK